MRQKDGLEFLRTTLRGKKIVLIDGSIVIDSVDDFIPQERAVNIPNAYAVVHGTNGLEYVIFDSGEVQTEAGIIVGQTDPLFPEPVFADTPEED